MIEIIDKKTLIRQFEQSANAFDKVLDLPDNLIYFRPFEDAWSIIEQIVHCLDFDIANFHRYRWAIVVPGTKVLSFDSSWTSKLNYQSYDLKLTIELIRMIRKYMSTHLYSIIEENWENYTYKFNNDNTFNLLEALNHYIKHITFHTELIDRNIKIFNN